MVSVSGVRGIVGETFTPEVVQKFVGAFGSILGSGSEVVLGRDSRTSGGWVLDLAAGVLQAQGHRVVVVGLCGTPTLGYAVRARGAAAGIMATASHNPVAWNALKFFGDDGGFIKPSLARRVFAAAEKPGVKYGDYAHQGERLDRPGLVETHLKELLKLVRPPKGGRKFKVVLDTVNGAGCVLVPEYLKRMGCKVLVINGEPTGLFAHRPEPLPNNLRQLSAAVKKHRADFGVAVDPDVDRVAFVDERGRAIGEEMSLAIATEYVMQWRPGPVVVNLSTSRMCEDIARSYGQRFYRTKVGEAHVADKMHKVDAAVGGEGNGGVIYPRLHPGRDALVGIAFALALLRKRGETMAELAASMPKWALSKLAVSRPDDYEQRLKQMIKALPAGKVDRRDGIRIDWPHGWVQLRKSNTEPIVRLLAEGRNVRAANKLLNEARTLLRL